MVHTTGTNLNTTSNQAKYQQYKEFSTWLRGRLDHLHVDIPGRVLGKLRGRKLPCHFTSNFGGQVHTLVLWGNLRGRAVMVIYK